MVNADQQWHIQRQTKQREAWIILLRMLHDPGKKIFVTINHSLLDWKDYARKLITFRLQKLAKRVVAEKGLNHGESVAPHPPFLLLCRRSSTPPENHLSSVISTFVVVFVFNLFHPQISSLLIWEFCGRDIIHPWACGDLHDWSQNLGKQRLCVVFRILSKICIDLFAKIL